MQNSNYWWNIMLETYLPNIINKILLGISLAAPIGPVSVEMIKRGINHGFWAAFLIRLGGALGCTLCLIVAYFGMTHLVKDPLQLNAIGLAGALLLLYMGIKTLFGKSKGTDLTLEQNSQGAMFLGFYLSIANPIAIVFWTSMYAAEKATDTSSGITELLLSFCIIIGVLIWGAGLSAALALGRNLLNQKVIRIISMLSGCAMIFFGLKYLYLIGPKLFCIFKVT